jgi:hypothetical protein
LADPHSIFKVEENFYDGAILFLLPAVMWGRHYSLDGASSSTIPGISMKAGVKRIKESKN